MYIFLKTTKIYFLFSYLKVFAFTFLAVFSFNSYSVQKNSFFDHYGTELGLPQTSVTCMVRDRSGFLWVGTQGGLSRFDGYQFKVFKHNQGVRSISGNWITGCLQDRQGVFWIATATGGLNRYEPETETFIHFKHNETNVNSLSDNRLWSLFEDHKGQLWIGTEAGGLNRFDVNRKTFTRFLHNENNNSTITAKTVKAIIEDSENRLWVGTYDGLNLFNEKTHDFVRFQNSEIPNSLAKNQIWALEKGTHGDIWIGTKNGLDNFNVKSGKFTHYKHSENENNSLSHNWVLALLNDNQGQIWVGTYGGGINIFQDTGKNFYSYRHDPAEKNSLSSDYLMAFTKDDNGNIWIGTDGGGLNRINKSRDLFNHTKHHKEDNTSLSHDFSRAILEDKEGLIWVATREGVNRSFHHKPGFEHFKHDPDDPTSLSANNVFSLYEDSYGNIWAGTYGAGLDKFNPKTKGFQHFVNDQKLENSLTSNYIYAITGATKGKLWLGTNKGLDLFDPKTKTAINYAYDQNKSDSLSQNTVFTVFQDKKNTLWVGTRSGLNRLEPNTDSFSHYKKGPKGLTSDIVVSITQSKDGYIWVGTMQGLNKLDPDTNEITHFTEQDGLPNETIFAIEEDKQGFIWLSTNNGIAKLNQKTNRIKIYSEKDGLQSKAFLLGSSFQNSAGKLYFGGVKGFNAFFPDDIQDDNYQAEVVFTDFLLFNESVNLLDDTVENKKEQYSLLKSVTHTDNLTLSHNESLVSFEFSGLNFSDPERNVYAYKLVGFDDKWIQTVHNKRFATYTNIPSGNYQLQVKATNKDGVWSDKLAKINIKVIPAPWLSWWAYLSYVSLSILIITVVCWLFYQKKLAQKDKDSALLVAKAKDTLLSNVSHEFKTPLTLILGPINNLLKTVSSSEQESSLKMIHHSALRLLNMVNQLLDLNKSNQLRQELYTAQNIVHVLKSVISGFSTHHINIVINDSEKDHLWVLMAPDSVEKLLLNLISNAVKYSSDNSEIIVTVSCDPDSVFIAIKDHGIGMAQSEQAHIFERFSRGLNASLYSQGTGIGLAIVKDILDSHQGSIEVKSELNVGSIFTVTLPLLKNLQQTRQFAHLSGSVVKISESSSQAQSFVNSTDGKVEQNTNEKQKEDKPSVLIIEDNRQMREYLIQILSKKYLCDTACDGKVGVEKALANPPDIIVSDVMMPVLDGFGVIRTIRENLNTSHIPILLLTAKNSQQSKLDAFNLLADDYLTKPFDEDVLLIHMHRLLNIRHLVKQALSQQQVHQPFNKIESSIGLSDKDTIFIDTLQTVMAENYDKVEFSIDDFSSALNMGTRSLQIKIKALFDTSPMDHLRLYRLEKSQELLIYTDKTIGHIADAVGFNSQSYFARCFKAEYHCSPKQFRLQKGT